jgi:hypothetical protein
MEQLGALNNVFTQKEYGFAGVDVSSSYAVAFSHVSH